MFTENMILCRKNDLDINYNDIFRNLHIWWRLYMNDEIIEIIEGHDPSSYFWIMPVKVIDMTKDKPIFSSF